MKDRHQDNGTFGVELRGHRRSARLSRSFESQGLYAYDMNGKLLWQKDLGDKQMRNEFGEGSTPVALRQIVSSCVWDHQGESFIVALDKSTRQRDLARAPGRDRFLGHAAGRRALAARAGRHVRHEQAAKLRPRNRPAWSGITAGLTMNPIPSPVADDGMVFVMSGFRGNSLKAIRLGDAKGDLPDAAAGVVDRSRHAGVPSPLLHDGIIYFLKTNSGVLSAFDAKTGKPHYQIQRLEGVPNVFVVTGRAQPGRSTSSVVKARRSVVKRRREVRDAANQHAATITSTRRRRWSTRRCI